VNRTRLGGDEQCAPGVLFQHTIASKIDLVQRIRTKPVGLESFAQVWKHLPQQRVARIAFAHASGERSWYQQGKLAAAGLETSNVIRIDLHHFQQFCKGTYGLAKRTLPICWYCAGVPGTECFPIG
jgi:hypothetical protein